MQGTTVVYAALCCSFIAIGGLILLVPLLTMTLDELQRDFDVDFQEVKGMTDSMWQDLIVLRKDIPLGLERKIRAAGYGGGFTKPHTYGKPPSYGYGYTKLKCCCAIEGAAGASQYPGSQPAHPTSYKCPAGYHGPPGPEGESGMPGIPGRPGSPGEDYPTTRNSAVTQGYPSITPSQGVGPGGLGYGGGDFRGGDGGVFGYGDYRPAQAALVCEPCPPGPPGHYGPKGKPGAYGKKGGRGSGGIPGKPGRAGGPGYPGEPGHKGLPGVVGPQGRNGADGRRGGKGLPGAKGESGGKGIWGPVGAPGLNGHPGPFGPPGKQGPFGPKGFPGALGSSGGQGPPGPPGKDALYCPCPDRNQEKGYGKIPSPSQTAYGAGRGINSGFNTEGNGRNYGANGFSSPSRYNANTRATYGPAPTGSTFLTYAPAEPTQAPQAYRQPSDTIFGPASPAITPYSSRSSNSGQSFSSSAFQTEEQRRFAPPSLQNRALSAVPAGTKAERAFVPLDTLAISSSSKVEASIPAAVFSEKTLHPAYTQKPLVIKPLATSGTVYRTRTIDTSPKNPFGWQRTTPFATDARLFNERTFSRDDRK